MGFESLCAGMFFVTAVFTDFENEVLARMRNLPDNETLFAMYDSYCASGEDVVEWVTKNVKDGKRK